MKIIAKKDFNFNGIIYLKGEDVIVDNKSQLIKLNEQGFIEPLSMKDIQNFGKEEPKKVEPKKGYKRIVEEE